MLISLSAWAQVPNEAEFQLMLKHGLRTEGIAKIERLEQDSTQIFCSNSDLINGPAGEKKAQEIQQSQLATIQPPSDGNYVGDWKRGEAIAQNGRGGTWLDSGREESGGGCYNCHQIDRKEIAYGNLGPSLWNYGKLRGYTKEVITYTWNKLYNAKAYSACSSMPRFGYLHLLTEQQIQDLMGLLLDPRSPVNQ
jgi:L-cysteine S-thiosulfotransferase